MVLDTGVAFRVLGTCSAFLEQTGFSLPSSGVVFARVVDQDIKLKRRWAFGDSLGVGSEDY